MGTSRPTLDFNAPFRGLLLEHELFRKPGSTFRDHTPAGYRSLRQEPGWGTFAPFSHTSDSEFAVVHARRPIAPRLLQAGRIDSRTDAQCALHEPSVKSTALQPAPHARAVAAIDLAERALEIGFLPRDHAVADDEGERHERHQRPEAVEGDGETDERQHHAEVDGIAREAVGPGVDD